MKKTSSFGWVTLAILASTVSCAKSPEGFCEDWAADTCEAITGCCESGATFDPDQCRLDLSAMCQQAVKVEAVHAGEAEFHSGAASDCFGTVETCKDIEIEESELAYDRALACLSIVSGFRPPGAACSSSDQCQWEGEYPFCYPGTQGSDNGVCVDVVVDDASCSFSFETNELHVCGEGKYCDLSNFDPPSTAPPTSRAFEFKASCKPLAGNGAACIDAKNKLIPCASGLYCDYASGDDAKCATRKSAGADCNSSNECAVGLDCRPNAGGPGETCQKEGGPYCFKPAVCGNGDCEYAEGETDTNCPADCGVSPNDCGDGFCDTSVGEDLTCPEDCGI